MNATPRPVQAATLDPDMTVDDIMRIWPPTIAVFLRHRFLCVGCPIAPFHTIAEACRAHGAGEAAFRRDLLRAAFGPG